VDLIGFIPGLALRVPVHRRGAEDAEKNTASNVPDGGYYCLEFDAQ